jgi:hypothetical protein
VRKLLGAVLLKCCYTQYTLQTIVGLNLDAKQMEGSQRNINTLFVLKNEQIREQLDYAA